MKKLFAFLLIFLPTLSFGGLPPVSVTGQNYLSVTANKITVGQVDLSTTNAKTGSLSGVLKATAGSVAGSSTTSDLTEGSNLYFTNARVESYVKSQVSSRILYVSQDSGNDSNDGSLVNPFKTISAAVTAANVIAAYYNQVDIHVAPATHGGSGGGSYSENVSLTQQGVNLVCDNPVQNTRPCLVNGALSVNLTGTSGGSDFIAALNEVYVAGFTFNNGSSTAVTFSGTTFQRLILINCYIQSRGGAAVPAVSSTNTGTNGGTPSALIAYDTVYENNSASSATASVTAGRFWMYGTTGTIQNDNSSGLALSVSGSGGSNIILNLVQLFGQVAVSDNTAQVTFNLSTITAGSASCISTPSSPSTGYVILSYFGCSSTNTNSITGSGVIVSSPGNARISSSGDYVSTVTQSFLPGLPHGEEIIGAASTGTNVLLSIKDGHVKIAQTTAPTTTLNANAGTGGSPSCTVSDAVDSAGKIALVTGTSTWASGTQCTINFNKAYGVAPICIATPSNAGSASKSVSQAVNFTTSTSALTIAFGNADTAQTTYNWMYHCIETQ